MAEPLVDRVIRRLNWLEPVAEAIQAAIGRIYGLLGKAGSALKNLLHGTTLLGHPLHPALTDIPLGAWTAGLVADYAAFFTAAIPPQTADFALAVGLVGAVGAALTGYTDFSVTYGHERRLAVVHGLMMTLVFALEAISLGLRLWGGADMHPAAVGLATLGLALALFGAYLGGHLTFGFGTMVNRNAFAVPPEDFVRVGPLSDFSEGKTRKVEAAGMIVLVVRRGDRFYAIANVCSHAGGPLDEGKLEGDIVTCPWHGSRFCIVDGSVKGGPATFPQPSFEARLRDGQVEVRLKR